MMLFMLVMLDVMVKVRSLVWGILMLIAVVVCLLARMVRKWCLVLLCFRLDISTYRVHKTITQNIVNCGLLVRLFLFCVLIFRLKNVGSLMMVFELVCRLVRWLFSKYSVCNLMVVVMVIMVSCTSWMRIVGRLMSILMSMVVMILVSAVGGYG